MGFWIPMAVMAGMGAMKARQDKKQYKKNMKLEGAKATYSPWTGIGPENVQAPSSWGTMLQYGAAGAGLGQNMKTQQNQEQLQKMMMDKWGAQGGNQTWGK